MARLLTNPYPEFKREYPLETLEQRMKRHVAILDRLENVSAALPEGQVVGGVLKFPIADGRAYYLVTSESPLTVQHLEFADGYRAPLEHIRGLRIEDVRKHLSNARGWFRLFAKQGKANSPQVPVRSKPEGEAAPKNATERASEMTKMFRAQQVSVPFEDLERIAKALEGAATTIEGTITQHIYDGDEPVNAPERLQVSEIRACLGLINGGSTDEDQSRRADRPRT